MTEPNENTAVATPLPLRRMSSRDFAMLGIENLAYVKKGAIDGEAGWEIHSADGNGIGLAPDRDLAFAAIRQNDLEPVSVH